MNNKKGHSTHPPLKITQRRDTSEAQLPTTREASEDLPKTTLAVLKSSIKHGLCNSFLVGDYYILMLVLKNTVTTFKKNDIAAASAFFTVFYSLQLHSISLAITEVQGVLGSQDIGAGNYDYASLRFKQGVATITVIFLLTNVTLSTFFAEFLTNSLGVQAELATLSQKMVVWALPAMMLRSVNDSLKAFLQNHKLDVELGLSYTVAIICMIPLTYLALAFLDLGVTSFGAILFLFELIGLVICLTHLKPLLGTEKVDFSIPVTKDLGSFLQKFLVFLSIDSPGYLVFEFHNYILALKHSESDMLVFTLFYTMDMVIFYIVSGFTVKFRTESNRLIGEKKVEEVISYINVYKRATCVAVTVTGLLIFSLFWLFEVLGAYGDPGADVRYLVSVVKFGIIPRTIAVGIWALVVIALKSVDKSNFVICFFTLPCLISNAGTYLMGLYFCGGVIGVIYYRIYQTVYHTWALHIYLGEYVYRGFLLEKVNKDRRKEEIEEGDRK